MATTLTVRNSMNFVQPILKQQNLQPNFGTEPALRAANIILGLILGAPFRWRFNRANFTLNVTPDGGTDYVVSVPSLGWIESAWMTNSAGSLLPPLEVAITLPKDGTVAPPRKIAPVYDDNAGNITFRTDKTPDAAYTISGDHQQKAALLTSVAATWGVVPDEFSCVFDQFFLYFMSLMVNDQRAPFFRQDALNALLGAQDGLDEQQKNIFLATFLSTSGNVARSQAMTNAGSSGRAK